MLLDSKICPLASHKRFSFWFALSRKSQLWRNHVYHKIDLNVYQQLKSLNKDTTRYSQCNSSGNYSWNRWSRSAFQFITKPLYHSSTGSLSMMWQNFQQPAIGNLIEWWLVDELLKKSSRDTSNAWILIDNIRVYLRFCKIGEWTQLNVAIGVGTTASY